MLLSHPHAVVKPKMFLWGTTFVRKKLPSSDFNMLQANSRRNWPIFSIFRPYDGKLGFGPQDPKPWYLSGLTEQATTSGCGNLTTSPLALSPLALNTIFAIARSDCEITIRIDCVSIGRVTVTHYAFEPITDCFFIAAPFIPFIK